MPSRQRARAGNRRVNVKQVRALLKKKYAPPKAPTREAFVAALQDAGASKYEERIKASGRATRIILPSGGVFWSRGWRGCPRCEQRVDIQVELQPFATAQDGATTIGWRCTRA